MPETGPGGREVPEGIPWVDACFVFDHAYEPLLHEAGARAVQFLPCAADADIFKPQTLSALDRATYEATISLVGVYSQDRGKIIAGMTQESGLGIWGPGWNLFLNGSLQGGPSGF